MKKRIFIAMHYMEIGGAEISLIGLLQALDYSRYDVDLFIYSHQGELMQFIPKEVRLLPEIEEYAQIEKSIKDNVSHCYWGIAAGKLIAKLKHRWHKYNNPSPKEDYSYQQYMIKEVITNLPSLYDYGLYDLAVSFMHPHNIVLEKINSKKKICWIHTDYSAVEVIPNMELPIWGAYDHVMSISPDVTKSFLQVFPSLKDKIIEMENILPASFVCRRAEEFDASAELAKYGDGVRLLSIGRFCEAKNYNNVPDICKQILNSGVEVKWFIIGYGSDEELIRQRIVEAGMQEHVILLGKRTNSYPYIKACDVYVQPSRYEGKSVTVREAQMLCKPVVVTSYPTASSQIQNGEDGMIVPLDNEGCAKELVKIIDDDELRNRLIKHLKCNDYGNEKMINIIYEIIENSISKDVFE